MENGKCSIFNAVLLNGIAHFVPGFPAPHADLMENGKCSIFNAVLPNGIAHFIPGSPAPHAPRPAPILPAQMYTIHGGLCQEPKTAVD